MKVPSKKLWNSGIIGLISILIISCGPGSKEKAASEDKAEEPRGLVEEEVDYNSDTLTMKGYMVYDSRIEGKRPAVLVVHEWWGHNDYARKRARMLAELGYVAFAVDMFGDGKVAEHPDDAGAFASEVMSNVESAKARFLARCQGSSI